MIDIAIPVLGRPGQVSRTATNIATATFGPYQVHWLCSPGDDAMIAECSRAGGQLHVMSWRADRADFARKVNQCFRMTDGEFLFTGATDLVFRPGWDEEALAVAVVSTAGVIGTNDLGNPLVKRGRHSTHSLVRRSYIEELGGTYDRVTGRVFHEGYDHQYVDNELVHLATLRGLFVSVQSCVIEHLHPHWGKADDDPTYAKAMRRGRADQQLFLQRSRVAERQHARGRRRG